MELESKLKILWLSQTQTNQEAFDLEFLNLWQVSFGLVESEKAVWKTKEVENARRGGSSWHFGDH